MIALKTYVPDWPGTRLFSAGFALHLCPTAKHPAWLAAEERARTCVDRQRVVDDLPPSSYPAQLSALRRRVNAVLRGPAVDGGWRLQVDDVSLSVVREMQRELLAGGWLAYGPDPGPRDLRIFPP